MDVCFQVKHSLQASTLARKFDISHWFPCGADVQAYVHVITKISRVDRLPVFLGMGLRSKEVGEEEEEEEEEKEKEEEEEEEEKEEEG